MRGQKLFIYDDQRLIEKDLNNSLLVNNQKFLCKAIWTLTTDEFWPCCKRTLRCPAHRSLRRSVYRSHRAGVGFNG